MKTKHKCKKCKMTFTEEIRLLRHYKKAHPSKPEHYKQKWYWDNPARVKLKPKTVWVLIDSFFLAIYY